MHLRLWAYLTKRLSTFPLLVIRNGMRKRKCKVDAVSHFAKKVLDGIDCELVKQCYNHCFKGEIVDWI